MMITTRFNRFAAGLTAVLCLTAPTLTRSNQEAARLIPEGQNPNALTQIYERLSARSRLPNPADFRIASTVTAVSNIPDNQWLRDLKNMPPEQAEQEVKACLSSLCDHKYPFLSPTDTFIARLMVLEALFNNGLDPEEFRTYSEFLSRHEADPAVYERDKRICEIVAAALLDSAAYRNLRAKIVPTARITAINANEQFHLRRDFMQHVSDRLRAEYGHAPIPVYLDKFPVQLSGTAALMISENYTGDFPSGQIVLVNYLPTTIDNPDKIIELMAHETRHSIDFSNRAALLEHRIESHDPRFTHIAVINLNENAVIPLCDARTYAQIECPQQYSWYRNQYRERSAVDFARKFLEQFKQEIRRRENHGALSGLKPEKLQLPA